MAKSSNEKEIAMERERVNCVVPRGDFAEAVKGYIYSITLKKPFSTEYYDDIYIQAELTWSERRKVDAFIDKIDEFGKGVVM